MANRFIIHLKVTHFSRKTGDYSNLSAVDLDLLALSYQLCKEKYDPTEFEQLKLEPGKNLNVRLLIYHPISR